MFSKVSYFLTGALLLLLTGLAAAQPAQRDMEKEQRIWQQLQAIAPDAVETFKAATQALDQNNFAEAVRLYEIVYKKAPNFDVAMRRLGGSLVLSGRKTEGLALLEAAVRKKESPENFFSVAQYLALPPDGSQPRREDLERALPYVRHAVDLNQTDDPRYLILWAMIAVKTGRLEYVRQATARLLETHPDIMETHYFAAWVGVEDKDWRKVEAELERAQALGLPFTAAEEVRNAAGLRDRPTVWRYARYALYAVGAWLVGLELLFVFGRLFSKKTLRWLETSDPNALAGQERLRKYYRWLINVAGVYYYVSLPVILFLALAIAASVAYAVITLHYINIKIVLVLVIGALLTVYSLLRSLFIKVKDDDPGRVLRESEAPELFALAREVAEVVGTRPVDEIRVTPATEMAVYERGSFRERAQDRGRRVLVLGVANLNDFELNAFRAVLAHEYGHFRHRDTAGGDVALRVNNDMMKFAVALAQSGQAVWYNLAFQFLRLYHFIFRRISHGATRLQEVMADRLAALTYSPQAFEAGLRHVMRREAEFEDVAYWEITDAAKSRRTLANLYELPVSNAIVIEEKIDEAMARATSEDDTHPAPAERFRLAHRVTFNGPLPPPRMVWELFADRAALTDEMSTLVARFVCTAGA
ncbi:MAG TPA: M48 family metalloprotease [Blastocatellia bacterium]|nr:M48 family metalloprotease [Blastocatellia bacterium]